MGILGHHLLFRLLSCISVFALLLYSYIDKQNVITKLQIEIPKLEEEVRILREENDALVLEIERLEDPRYLIVKRCQPPFSHLRQPSHVLKVEEE